VRALKKLGEAVNWVPGFLLLFVLVSGLWVSWPWVLKFFASFAPIDSNALGPFGDMFGALSSLFAAGALLGAAAGVLLQTKALEKQREQFAAQQSQIERQNFEATFFELLRLLREVVRETKIELRTEKQTFEGAHAFEQLARKFVRMTNVEVTPSDPEDPRAIEECYALIHDEAQDALGHYFQNLYHLFKFIDGSAPADRRDDYASLARAQLSRHELILLAGNVLTQGVDAGCRKYAERFALLKALGEPERPSAYARELPEQVFLTAVRELLQRRGLGAAVRQNLRSST
jgi:hypothetical protein